MRSPDGPPGGGVADELDEHFRALYLANFNAILAYALRRTDERSDAADVASETFLVAWRRLHEAPPGDLRPWLFGIARNVLANQQRSGRRRTRLGVRLRTVVTEADLPDHAGAVVERDRVRQALATLSESDRELLTLVAWDDLSPTEAAEALEISPGAARTRLMRARQRLAKALGDDAADDGHVQVVRIDYATEEGR